MTKLEYIWIDGTEPTTQLRSKTKVVSNDEWNNSISMLKRLDLTIFEQAEKTAAGTFEPAIVVLGLAEGGVGYAAEDGMVTDEMAAAVEAAAAEIASGAMAVADWSQE